MTVEKLIKYSEIEWRFLSSCNIYILVCIYAIYKMANIKLGKILKDFSRNHLRFQFWKDTDIWTHMIIIMHYFEMKNLLLFSTWFIRNIIEKYFWMGQSEIEEKNWSWPSSIVSFTHVHRYSHPMRERKFLISTFFIVSTISSVPWLTVLDSFLWSIVIFDYEIIHFLFILMNTFCRIYLYEWWRKHTHRSHNPAEGHSENIDPSGL